MDGLQGPLCGHGGALARPLSPGCDAVIRTRTTPRASLDKYQRPPVLSAPWSAA